MDDIQKLRSLVSETFPCLKIDEFTMLRKGKAGVICLANKEIVFKIPLNTEREITQELKNEATVLRFLESKLDIKCDRGTVRFVT